MHQKSDIVSASGAGAVIRDNTDPVLLHALAGLIYPLSHNVVADIMPHSKQHSSEIKVCYCYKWSKCMHCTAQFDPT